MNDPKSRNVVEIWDYDNIESQKAWIRNLLNFFVSFLYILSGSKLRAAAHLFYINFEPPRISHIYFTLAFVAKMCEMCHHISSLRFKGLSDSFKALSVVTWNLYYAPDREDSWSRDLIP